MHGVHRRGRLQRAGEARPDAVAAGRHPPRNRESLLRLALLAEGRYRERLGSTD
ncbi:hypothetical protein [Phycicoccus sp. HDW14]|uniref:hypothetical protein n=1 Tax=Phycicoccus sp. HDW14 TaxID=2714941 RepID=UPI001F0FFB3F|nr:hypothetical protein [Phycicoccus sp. HDW14]